MRTLPRPALAVALLLVAGLVLGGWGVFEAQRQQRAMEESLSAAASLLAQSLGPSLAAASAATDELDELLTARLLDNARLLARLQEIGTLDEDELSSLRETNDLEAIQVLDGRGEEILESGRSVLGLSRGELQSLLDGRADELVLGPVLHRSDEHLAAAVRIPSGGAVLIELEVSSLRTFSRRIGVQSLLDRLVETQGVLFLQYREKPAGIVAESSWDGGPLPPAAAAPSRRSLRGRTTFEVSVPVATPAGREASLRVGLDGAPLEQAAAAAMRRSLVLGLFLLAMGLSGVAYALVETLRVREREETLARLASAEAARRRSERLAAAGALTAGLAHEVRSPLNAIALAAQRLERKLPEDDERRSMAHRIGREVRRLEAVLQEFLDLARPTGEAREPTDLLALAREVASLLESEADERRQEIRVSSDGRRPSQGAASPSCAVDREAVRRALVNLTRNGLEASPEGGVVQIIVACDGTEARIKVCDRGTGLDPELGERAFDPFVTTRAAGTGLGLSLVRRVAEEHGGTVSLHDRAGGGAEAILLLPLEREPATPAATAARTHAVSSRQASALDEVGPTKGDA